MRTKTVSVSERDLMYVIGGQLFDQAPNRQPRKSEVIMQKVKEAFRKDAYNDNEYFCLRIAKEDIYKYVDTMLKAIPEFVELNLSQIEFEKNISVDDESRPKYAFSTRYDKHTSESWKSDFIDLDAFVQNVNKGLLDLLELDKDCFCCKHTKSELCKTCYTNPAFKSHYECTREPKGKYTFSCRYDCSEHLQICCEECGKKDTCTGKCDDCSETCNNKVIN